MTRINIGTDKGNITNVEIDKHFKEIKYTDIQKIVRDKKPEAKNIQGWADVSHTVKNK